MLLRKIKHPHRRRLSGRLGSLGALWRFRDVFKKLNMHNMLNGDTFEIHHNLEQNLLINKLLMNKKSCTCALIPRIQHAFIHSHLVTWNTTVIQLHEDAMVLGAAFTILEDLFFTFLMPGFTASRADKWCTGNTVGIHHFLASNMAKAG